jgi:(R)-2-hydroxyacyl-CoA dehydratese activating ATPase
MRHVAGIDIGSGFTKAVILTGRGENSHPAVLGKGMTKTGVDIEGAARRALDAALDSALLKPSEDLYVATTGFGRYSVGFRDIQITEITSGARGAHFLFPQCASVLDIGSQSTRAISLTGNGRVHGFKTNDKCAAGSGSFIVRAAKYLQLTIEEVGELSLKASNPQPISSVCAVLAESEIINHISAGVSIEDILRGIHDSLADRAANLLRRVGIGEEVTFIGGLAHQRGMIKALEDRLKVKVNIPESCDYVCALGAALLGLKRLATIEGEENHKDTKTQRAG